MPVPWSRSTSTRSRAASSPGALATTASSRFCSSVCRARGGGGAHRARRSIRAWSSRPGCSGACQRLRDRDVAHPTGCQRELVRLRGGCRSHPGDVRGSPFDRRRGLLTARRLAAWAIAAQPSWCRRSRGRGKLGAGPAHRGSTSRHGSRESARDGPATCRRGSARVRSCWSAAAARRRGRTRGRRPGCARRGQRARANVAARARSRPARSRAAGPS